MISIKKQPFVMMAALFVLTVLSSGADAQMVMTVRVGKAQQMDVARSLEFTGSIEPWRSIELSAQVAGVVQSIPVEEGDSITSLQLVCQLDTESAQIELERSKAELDSAQAELDRYIAGYRSEEIDEARQQMGQDQAEYMQAKDDWDRQRPLLEKGVISENEATALKARYEATQAAVARSQASLDKLLAGFRKEEISRERAKVAELAARVHEVQRRLRLHRVTAPVDCVVVERLKEPGEWVDVGDAVASLVVLDPLKVRIDVPQVYLNKVTPGLEAMMEVDGLPGQQFKAVVQSVVPSAGAATRNFPVLMRLDNPGGRLRSGLFTRLRLKLSGAKSSLVVPREAVLTRGERLVVLAADPLPPAPAGESKAAGDGQEAAAQAAPQPNAQIRELTVRQGNEVDGKVVIDVLEGGTLEDGAQVVILGGSKLQTGMPVLILPADQEAGS